MTILTLLEDATDEIAGQPRPVTVVGSTDRDVQRLLAFAHRILWQIRQDYDFPVLTREGTITLVSGQANYALPVEFERFVYNTHWDDSNNWMLIGPYSPQEWQAVKRGLSTSSIRKGFRVKDRQDNKIYLDPTPSSSEAGQILYFEYISKTCILPPTWVTNEALVVGNYRSYNGNIYKVSVAGTTGATAPTHTTGSAANGTTTLDYQDMIYDKFLSDNDYSLIDENLISLGVIWRFLKAQGNDFADTQAEYKNYLAQAVAGFTSARVLSFNPVTGPFVFGPWNIPDSFNI